MAGLPTRIVLPPSRTICMFYAMLLLFGTNVTLLILRTMMSYASGPVVMSSDFNVRFPAANFQSVAAAAMAFGCGHIGNGSLENDVESMKCKRKLLRAALSLDKSGALKTCGFKDEYETAIKGTPLQPLKNFANPCWLASVDSHPGDNTIVRYKAKLRCLPGVLILGSGRSGVRDLSESLIVLPEMYGSSQPQTQLWIEDGQNNHCKPFSRYVDSFDESARQILHGGHFPSADRKDNTLDISVFHKGVIFGAAPRYIQGWTHGDVTSPEDNHTLNYLPQTVKLVTPSLKLIFLLRDPVDRLYSDFCLVHNRAKHGMDIAKDFDSVIREVIVSWQQCIRERPEISCIRYLPSVATPRHKMTLQIFMSSLYYLYIRNWLAAFPASQMFFVKSEDYFLNRATTIEGIVRYLELRSRPVHVMRSVRGKAPVNQGHIVHEMWNRTRRLLVRFFQPYNIRLSELLSDDRFLWRA